MDNKTIKKLIDQYDNKQLMDLICYIVGRNDAAGQALLDYCQKNEKNVSNRELIIENQIMQHWSNASEIIDQFDQYGGGPESEEDDAYEELDVMEKLFEENEVSWKCRKTVLDEMLEFVASDNSGFTDTLVDIALLMCKTKEENLYLADYLVKYANSYYRGLAAHIYLENGEEDKYLEGKMANLQYSTDYLELAEYYKKKGSPEQALNIVLQGLDRGNGRLDGIYEYLFKYYTQKNDEAALEKLYNDAGKRRWNQETITELMYQYYKDKGNYEKQKNALLKLFTVQDTRELNHLYQLSMKELKQEDFQNMEKTILQEIKKRNLSVYFDILLSKDQPEEVIDYLLNNGQYRRFGINDGHYFTKRLAGRYPREVLEMYWSEAAFYAGLGKENNYRHAVGILREIRKIMKDNKWTEEWNERYTAFVNEHRRKKLLMKELEKFKKS